MRSAEYSLVAPIYIKQVLGLLILRNMFASPQTSAAKKMPVYLEPAAPRSYLHSGLTADLEGLATGVLTKDEDEVTFMPITDHSSTASVTVIKGKGTFSLKFVYGVSYERGTNSCFTIKARQISRLYICENSLAVYFRLNHPVTHFVESVEDESNERTALHGDVVSEPTLSDYFRLKPCMYMKARSVDMLVLITEFLESHKLQRRLLSKVRHEEPGKGKARQTLKDVDKAFVSELRKVPFNLQYLVFCLLSAGILSPNKFPFEIFTFLKSCNEIEATKVVELVYTQNVAGLGRGAGKALATLKEKLEFVRKHPSCVKLEERDNFFYVRRIVVTPSLILCQVPTLQESCRALRKYVKADDVIRVSFRDHDLKEIHSLSGYINYINSILNSGLKIGCRKYVFLGYSQSQIRERSCWLVNDIVSPCKILGMTGDYNLTQRASVVAARIGHSFATTTPTIELAPEDVTTESDIIHRDYVYTDGIGKMSPDICAACNARSREKGATAFQIRLAGYKGVIMLDPKLKGHKVVLRQSMKKFESGDLTLEIVRAARYMRGYLNREIIVLLGTLGVPDSVFLDILKDTVKDYLIGMREDAEIGPHLINLEWPEYLCPLRDYMRSVPAAVQHYPFLRAVALVDMIKHLKDIKKKHRLYIEQSCRLIGVVDDTQQLAPDEVFIQIERPEHPHERTILNEPVFVTRNPCLHPSDIRILRAVYWPRKLLGHLVNVIVFSSQISKRPVFNMMSNGDLDGDIYFICWDKRIFPTRSVDPMPSAEKKHGGIEEPEYKMSTIWTMRDDIISFFSEFLYSDCIGRVANLHMAHADKSAERALDPQCVKLAQLHSTAVDYAKHGIKIPPGTLVSYSLREWPDFLHRSSNPTRKEYKSTKALGLMYRHMNAVYDDVMTAYSNLESSASEHSELDLDLIVDGFQDFLELAMDDYISFEQNILWIMRMYGVRLEAEAVSGNVIKLDKLNKTKSRTQEIKTELCRLMFRLIKHYNNAAFTDGMVPTKEVLHKLASARYVVTFYAEDKELKMRAKLGEALGSAEWARWKKQWKHYWEAWELARLEERLQRIRVDIDSDEHSDYSQKIRKMWSYPWLINGKELLEIKLAAH